MAAYVAGTWRVEVIGTRATPDDPPYYRYKVRDHGFLHYEGTDLVRVRLILEEAGVAWGDLRPAEEPEAAAG